MICEEEEEFVMLLVGVVHDSAGPAVRAAIRANRFRCVDDRGAKDSYDGFIDDDDDDAMAVDGVDFEGGTADVFLEGV
eukprot:scaffold1350_cov56-Cyclotella_meneghiniana.AAC.27